MTACRGLGEGRVAWGRRVAGASFAAARLKCDYMAMFAGVECVCGIILLFLCSRVKSNSAQCQKD